MRVVYSGRARRDLGRLQQNVAARITRAIDRFAEAETGDVRRIRGRPGITRLRVGDWRVLFRSERLCLKTRFVH